MLRRNLGIRRSLLAATLASTTALVGMALHGTAYAQTDEELRDASVLTRTRREFDPLGVRAGSFFIFPQLRSTARFDDNIFANDDNEESDIVFEVQPSVSVRSNWTRHRLNLNLDADVGFFVDNDDSNYQDFGGSIDGRFEAIGESTLNYRLFARRDHEERDDPEESGADEITQFFDAGIGVNYRHVINRVFIQPGIGASRRDFDDADQINNDDRDIFRFTPNLRVGLALSPDLALFVAGEYNEVIHDETPDDLGVDRDSRGFAVTAGAEFDLTGQLLGEIQAGFQQQEFDDSSLDDFSGVRADGSLTYNLTPLTAVVVTGGAGLEETTTSLDGVNSSANFRVTAGAQLTHEFRRNIIGQVSGNYVRDDFEGIDRTDDRFLVEAGIEYALNRNAALNLAYTFSTRSSDVDGVEFDRNVILAGATLRF